MTVGEVKDLAPIPNQSPEDFVQEIQEDEEVKSPFRLECNVVSEGAQKCLPTLPFHYEKDKCWTFVCKHPAFPWAGIISDLDRQFLRYLGDFSKRTMKLQYVEVDLSEIIGHSAFSDASQQIEDLCNVLDIKRDLYDGVGSGFANLTDSLDSPIKKDSRAWQTWKRCLNTYKNITSFGMAARTVFVSVNKRYVYE